jgi:hypothetical protein
MKVPSTSELDLQDLLFSFTNTSRFSHAFSIANTILIKSFNARYDIFFPPIARN